MLKWLKTFFGSRQQFVEVKFYQDAKPHGRHGSINVTNRRLGLVEKDVDFVFVGITTPPALSPRTINDIFEAANDQGYIIHHITTYWLRNDVFIPRDLFTEIDDNVISFQSPMLGQLASMGRAHLPHTEKKFDPHAR